MRRKSLIFTNVFPNGIEGNKGLRMKIESDGLLVKGFDIKIIAPIPWVVFFHSYTTKFLRSKVKLTEIVGEIEIFRPRYLTIPKIGSQFSGVLYFLSLLILVLKIRRNFKFELIVAYWTYPDGYAASIFAKMFKVPLIIRPRGSDINVIPNNKRLKPFVVLALQSADRIIAVSGALKRKIQELGILEQKILVITSGIDQNRFFVTDKNEARNSLGITNDKKIILFVGNFVMVKGLDNLLRAISIVKTLHDGNFLLYLLGSGPLRNSLCCMIKQLGISDCVKIEGEVPNCNLNLWMSASDLFCLPSRNEGWPNVLMEVLACGVPVIATRVGGIPEIINDEKLGILVEPDNPESLAQAIRQGLSRNWNRESLVARVKNQTWSKIVNDLSCECQRIFNGKKGFCSKDKLSGVKIK